MIPSDVPAETEELQVQEEALDTVVAEPENSTKDENLIRTETQEGISEIEKVEQEKDIPNIEFEAVLGEFNTDTNQNVAVSAYLTCLKSYLVSWALANSSLILCNGRGTGVHFLSVIIIK